MLSLFKAYQDRRARGTLLLGPPSTLAEFFWHACLQMAFKHIPSPSKNVFFWGGGGGGKFLKKYSDQLFLANQAILRTFVFLKKFFFFGGGSTLKEEKIAGQFFNQIWQI